MKKHTEVAALRSQINSNAKELSAVKEQLVQAIIRNPSSQGKKEEQEKPIAILIGDSNTARLLPDIKSQLNTYIVNRQPAMTISEARKWAEDTSQQELAGTTCIIHTATNDVHNGRKARDIHWRLKETVNTLQEKGAICWVMQMPPMYTSNEESREVDKYNGMLEESMEGKLIPSTPVESDRKMLDDDGYHLSKKGTAAMAVEVAKKVQGPQSAVVSASSENTKGPVDEKGNPPGSVTKTITQDVRDHVETINTFVEYAGRVIGQGGSTIKRLKSKYEVQINTKSDGDKRQFEIIGKKTNTKEAKKEISSIISEANKKDHKAREQPEAKAVDEAKPQHKHNIVCRFYMDNKCNRGSRCEFLHTKEHPVDISPRTPAHNTQRRGELGDYRTPSGQENRQQHRQRPRSPSGDRSDRRSSHDRHRGRDQKRRRSPSPEDMELAEKIMGLVKMARRH